MTNTQIPYSFTPGSKAKAQEVNANFIALAEGIDTSREYTTSELLKVNTKLDDKALTLANKNLNNVTGMSNCILETPDGSTTFSGATLTLKKGLKVLLPDGRNEDGTLKNIEYTLDEEKTLTNPDVNTKYWYITQDGVYSVNAKLFAFKQIETVTDGKIRAVFDAAKNISYTRDSDNGTFQSIPFTIIAKTSTDGKLSDITNLSMHQPYALIKNNDMEQRIAGVNCIVETYKNSTFWFRIYQDGWIEQGGMGYDRVNFMIPFKQEEFSILLTVRDDVTNANYFNLSAVNRHLEYFDMFRRGYAGGAFWYACGY